MSVENTPRGQLEIVAFALGPVVTNTYLIGDPVTRTAVVIDPAWQGEFIFQEAKRREWHITDLWITHAHFDHFGGVAAIVAASPKAISVGLHPAELPTWRANGGAGLFGFTDFNSGPEPTVMLEHAMKLYLGSHEFEVRHTPGHTEGHVLFLARQAGMAFCGDLIFQGSVGRTDLPGGDWDTLLRSIREEVLVLPDETQLLSGHGPVTTVGRERQSNPFLRGDIGLF